MKRFFRWVRRLFRPKPKPTPTVVPTTGNSGSKQRFPTGYKAKVGEWYSKMEVGEGLLGRQKKSHIDWYSAKLLEGKERYEKASMVVKQKSGYDIPWQIIGVIHGMEASFNFNNQILNGQPINKETTWVPKKRGPWASWEDSCVDAFTWDDDYKIIPSEWTPENTALFNERWNGMSYWNKGKPSPYLWGFSSIQVPGKFTSDHNFSSSAITMQVGVMVQLEKIGFWNEHK